MSNDTTHVENGAPEVATRLGITYRQIDHWCRTGMISLECDASGSGSRRKLTDVEIQALTDTVERLRFIEELENELRSGIYFAERVDFYKKTS